MILPPGGGSFEGFGFVVVTSKDDAERILKEWDWGRSPEESTTLWTDGGLRATTLSVRSLPTSAVANVGKQLALANR